MVERIWSARAATRDRADAYAAYFDFVVLPELAAVAGDDIERAVVHDEAAALFFDYDHSVRHFETVSDDPA